jgi:hypothetical protein
MADRCGEHVHTGNHIVVKGACGPEATVTTAVRRAPSRNCKPIPSRFWTDAVTEAAGSSPHAGPSRPLAALVAAERSTTALMEAGEVGGHAGGASATLVADLPRGARSCLFGSARSLNLLKKQGALTDLIDSYVGACFFCWFNTRSSTYVSMVRGVAL